MSGTDDSGPDQLASIIARYLTADEAGEAPDRNRLLNEYPELAEELRPEIAT